MHTYKLEFNNGKRCQTHTENLDQTHAKIISYMNKNNLIECIIKCPNGMLRRVRKTGETHFKHNGFSFD
jgi:hypothetical protein